jgi:hypothetical protein
MGILIGAGCVAYALARKRFNFAAAGAVGMAIIMAALLRTQSRGALIALAGGLLLLLATSVAKARNRKVTAVVLAFAILLGGFVLIAGEKTLGRFTSSPSMVDDSARLRRAVWRESFEMAKDAPLLGCGVGSFTGIFPFYQDLEAEEVYVKHPESSMLQWLVELGIIPLLLGGSIAVAFVIPHAKASFARESSFYLAAGGIGAVAVLLIHSLIDVPAHRWGTAGFALAALAVACPLGHDALKDSSRAIALVPLGIGAFWILPILWNAPAWSPFQLDRVVALGSLHPRAHAPEIRTGLDWFPLNPRLHFLHAQVLQVTGADPARWQAEYRVAARLLPASSKTCAQIAQQCEEFSPSLAIHYWQLAVERASLHRSDFFRDALDRTSRLPDAEVAWQSYVDAHPELALLYAEFRGDADGKTYYDQWWQERGSKQGQLAAGESESFLRTAARWGNAEQLSAWARLHADRAATDSVAWIKLLHGWKADRDAWTLVVGQIPEPDYSAAIPRATLRQLGDKWESNPADRVNAQTFAQVLEQNRQHNKAEEVILKVAADYDAPKWFLAKAAYCLARQERFDGAVGFALRALAPDNR